MSAVIEGEVVGNRNKRQRHAGLFGVLRAQGNVLLALMLRDVRTRVRRKSEAGAVMIFPVGVDSPDLAPGGGAV